MTLGMGLSGLCDWGQGRGCGAGRGWRLVACVGAEVAFRLHGAWTGRVSASHLELFQELLRNGRRQIERCHQPLEQLAPVWNWWPFATVLIIPNTITP